jgi:tRNA dimethylallyltransferase
MSGALPPPTPVICGPTAGGKSDLALDLALTLRDKHHIPAEIVTADAFQVYSGLDIGTAKPTPAERRGIPQHLIDIVPPSDPALRALRASGGQAPSAPESPSSAGAEGSFTLDDWLGRANRTIADLRSRNILPIVVGGTHLYIKALLEGLFDGPEPDHALRVALAAMNPAQRRAELERVDPLAAARIHPNDLRRTIRALEVFRLTGKPISTHQQQWDKPAHGTLSASEGSASPSPPPAAAPQSSNASTKPKPLARAQGSDFLLITLDWQTEPLNARINARVKQMMSDGLLTEVRSLVESRGFTPQSAEALGYKQLIPIVRAALDTNTWPPPAPALEEAVEKIKIETRRFAKNQRTWLRRLSTTPGAIRLPAPPSDESPRSQWVPRILAALNLS